MSKAPQKPKITKGVRLIQDNFGMIKDANDAPHFIKRFTWKNHNKIEVQLINYGATITSIRLPDRNDKIVDVVLGFDDIEGYQAYPEHFFGATIGRFADKIINGTFHINKKQFQISKNLNEKHYANGGFQGFDKVIWEWYVKDNLVTLSHVSPALSEGFPGNLLVQIDFELTQCNEFKIDMRASTTAPTIVNLANNIYFNLAGHGRGEDELHKHTVILNANCHTPVDEQGFPTGTILNVTHTKYDFQTPKILKHLMKDVPDGEYDQNFCVNRGVEQDICFVGRVTHVPSGRVLEVYSNQSGVQFYTANRFSPGLSDISVADDSKQSLKTIKSVLEQDLILIDRVHEETCKNLEQDIPSYDELKDLVKKIRTLQFSYENDDVSQVPKNTPIKARSYINDDAERAKDETSSATSVHFELTPLQMEYLVNMKMACLQISNETKDTEDYFHLMAIIQEILNCSVGKEEVFRTVSSQMDAIPEYLKKYMSDHAGEIRKQMASGTTLAAKNSSRYTRDGKIHGKKNTIYQKHGAFSLRTQNYPNAIYHGNFPNCVLHPGEKYCHKIVYKFWIMDGIPSNWIKRDFFCPPYKYY